MRLVEWTIDSINEDARRSGDSSDFDNAENFVSFFLLFFET
jgi:hypothetical protein